MSTTIHDWARFRELIGSTWDVVVEAGAGNPTAEESAAITSLGYWGQPITIKTMGGLARGIPFAELEKQKPFGFKIFAPDGTHSFRYGTKAGLLKKAKKYGPPSYPSGDRAWGDDDGYRYELEGATIQEVFG